MVEDEAWVGLDLGTQSVRAMVVTLEGRVLGEGAHPLTGRREGCRHEQDPEAWWEALTVACRSATSGLAAEMGGLAVCATSGSFLLVDPGGRPIGPGIMYDDGRATEEARYVEEAGAAEVLGHRVQPAWALPKLLWLLRRNAVPPGARLAHQADWVVGNLVGGLVPADTSHALKSGYDLRRDTWPGRLLDQLGVPEELLPEVVRPGTSLGTVCPEAAEATGLPEDTPVVAGMTDGCAAQLAAGAVKPGSWNSVLGTTLVVKGVSEQLVCDPLGVVYSHRSPEGAWLPGGASSVGAGALSAAFPEADLDRLTGAAAAHEPAPAVAYPLVARGERFPFLAPEAEGFLLGEAEDEAERCAALLQGVAFVERLCYDYLHLLGASLDGPLSFTGGGTRSRYWTQLRADVLGRAVRVPETTESALGMAMLAAASRRGEILSEVAAGMARTREEISPRRQLGERLLPSFVRLIDELERREWMPASLADHARRRTES